MTYRTSILQHLGKNSPENNNAWRIWRSFAKAMKQGTLPQALMPITRGKPARPPSLEAVRKTLLQFKNVGLLSQDRGGKLNMKSAFEEIPKRNSLRLIRGRIDYELTDLGKNCLKLASYVNGNDCEEETIKQNFSSDVVEAAEKAGILIYHKKTIVKPVARLRGIKARNDESMTDEPSNSHATMYLSCDDSFHPECTVLEEESAPTEQYDTHVPISVLEQLIQNFAALSLSARLIIRDHHLNERSKKLARNLLDIVEKALTEAEPLFGDENDEDGAEYYWNALLLSLDSYSELIDQFRKRDLFRTEDVNGYSASAMLLEKVVATKSTLQALGTEADNTEELSTIKKVLSQLERMEAIARELPTDTL